jgi:hypothetical protein
MKIEKIIISGLKEFNFRDCPFNKDSRCIIFNKNLDTLPCFSNILHSELKPTKSCPIINPKIRMYQIETTDPDDEINFTDLMMN